MSAFIYRKLVTIFPPKTIIGNATENLLSGKNSWLVNKAHGHFSKVNWRLIFRTDAMFEELSCIIYTYVLCKTPTFA